MPVIQPHQQSLTKNGTHLPHGVYDGLIADVSTARWDKQGLLIKRRRSERKTWIFFGFFSEELTCGIAIADAGALSIGFSYFFVPGEDLFIEDKINIPLGFPDDFDPGLHDSWQLKNYSIRTDGTKITLKTSGKFDLELVADHTDNGISVVAPSQGDRPFNFTYKDLAIPTKASVKYKGKTYTHEGDHGSIDFTKGYPPRNTFWNWLSFIGTLEDGKTIAVNLVDRFNGNLENCVWYDGKKYLTSKAEFSCRKPLDKNTWSIRTRDGMIDCTLEPRGSRSENLNLLVMKSLFIQPFGRVQGTLNLDGKSIAFKAFGVGEEHEALW